jgi:FlaA1/EpsC-like NDP-sugar epimerase
MHPRFKLPPLNFLAILHDASMAGASFILALYLRLGNRTWEHAQSYLIESTLVFVALTLGALLYWRAYRHLWRYTSLTDLMVIARGASVALLLFYIALFTVMRLEHVPRSVPFIHWMTAMLCLMGPRVGWRLLHDRALIDRLLGRGSAQVDVLLIGATPQAEMFIRESTRSVDFPYRVVGLIDNDPRQHGREIQHVRIYGSTADIDYVLRKLERKGRRPARMIIATAAINRVEYEALLAVATAHELTLSRLPSLSELKAGDRVHDIRAVAVEDILGRPEAVLDRPAMRALVEGKRVLVTGAGGSIGSELVRQIIGMNPAHLTLFEQSEYQLYLIDQTVGDIAPTTPRSSLIGDVRDAEQLTRAFASARPEIVFHAAAIKHVPLAEANPDQAVLTNILGSKQVADACVAHGVGVMVQISTDKAVNPTSVMGATKRAAEIYCHTLAEEGAATRFVTVRFGNVLNSTGSVVPLFQIQIARGGPVTVTHPEMTRYFMSISEAVQLVLQAAVLGLGETNRAPIFVLDMGEPVKIVDLAEQMIRLAGLRPNEDIAIAFTGLRPGEKLFEELFHDAESMLATRHPLIRLARARQMDRLAVLAALRAVIAAAKNGERSRIPLLLTESVSEYTPDTGIAA